MANYQQFGLQCPLPTSRHERVLLAHGGGGRLMQELIQEVFIPAFRNPLLAQGHDGVVFPVDEGRMAFTTDSYVVQPLFFPGGDIGTLAVNGTVNDLAMSGAKPLFLSVGYILEEGLPMETLRRVTASMAKAAAAAGVFLVTGDTKVVDRGKADGLYINTAGVGVVPVGVQVSPQRVRPGDRILLSGDLGSHGIAVMSVREGLAFDGLIQSDSAPLNAVVEDLIKSGIEVSCMRDLTRGGLASALNEIAKDAGVGMTILEDRVPVKNAVRGACELLGLDPLYVANEGRCVLFVPSEQADAVLSVLHRHSVSQEAVEIGEVTEAGPSLVVLQTSFHTERVLDWLSGEQLPRIC